MNGCNKQKSDTEKLLKMVIDKRSQINPATGGRKLHLLLQEQMKQQNIKMGKEKHPLACI